MRWIRAVLATWLFVVAPAWGQVPAPLAPVPPEAPTGGTAVPSTPRGLEALTRADAEAWLDGFLPYALGRGNIAGAVVVVVRDGQVLLQKGYGHADVATRQPVSPEDTLFRVGSVSKLLTWTAVMQQVEAGRLELDRDINSYLDFSLPPYDGQPITLRQLLTHTAGFEDTFRYLITDDPKKLLTLEQVLKKSLPPRVFAPGSTPAYSNYGASLAGYLVTRVSGLSFDDYIERHLFAPLGMRGASFRQPLPDALQARMSKGYRTADGEAQYFELIHLAPAGSLSASGADMAKFMISHLNGGAELLRPETARMMHDHRAPGIGPLNRMALGFYEQQVNGHRAIGHGGDTDWFHSLLMLFPDAHTGVFLSVNSAGNPGSVGALTTELFHQFANRYLPGDPPVGAVDAETARAHGALLAGHYVGSRTGLTNFMSVSRLFGQLVLTADAQGRVSSAALRGIGETPIQWTEVEPFVWRDPTTGERLAATVEGGRVTRVGLDSAPFMVFEPAPWTINAAGWVPAWLAAVLVLLLTGFTWPAAAFLRRHYGAPPAPRGPALSAYRWSRGFALGALGVLAGWSVLLVAMTMDMRNLGGPFDGLLWPLQILSPLAFLGLVGGSLGSAWWTWRSGGRWTAKLWSVLLVLAGLVVLWVAAVTHLLGFGLRY